MYKVLSENISSAVSVSGEPRTLSTIHAVTCTSELHGSSVADHTVCCGCKSHLKQLIFWREKKQVALVSLDCVVLCCLIIVIVSLFMYITDFLHPVYCCTSSVLVHVSIYIHVHVCTCVHVSINVRLYTYMYTVKVHYNDMCYVYTVCQVSWLPSSL